MQKKIVTTTHNEFFASCGAHEYILRSSNVIYCCEGDIVLYFTIQNRLQQLIRVYQVEKVEKRLHVRIRNANVTVD